jgi:hypothetical protein
MVAEADRPAVDEALDDLALRGAPQKRSVRVLRAEPPTVWLSIDVSRVAASVVPYLACVSVVSARRRLDSVPPTRRSPG